MAVARLALSSPQMIPMPPRTRSLRALAAAVVIATLAARASAQETQSPNLAPPAGADVIVIIPDSLQAAPRSLSELLRERVPSASVNRSTGALGASAFVSLRDASVVRGDDPLVVIDGIRQVSYRSSLDALDRRAPSVLDDIMLDDVARVEILNGPAAAANYGYDGQRGVIVVTTRQATGGAARYRASVTTSAGDDNANYTRNLARVSATGTSCPYAFEAEGYCTATSTSRYTPLLDRSPFRSASQARAHLGATGGVGALGYAASLGMERGSGTLSADAADRTVAALRLALPVGSMVRLGIASLATERGVSTPREGYASVIASGIGGGPIDCSPATPCGTDSVSGGYRTAPLARLEESRPHHRIGHLGNALTIDVKAASKISLQTNVAADLFRDNATLFDSSSGTTLRSFTRTTATERSWRVAGSQAAQLTTNVGAALSTTRLAVRLDVERSRGESISRAVAYMDSATAARFNLPPGEATYNSSSRGAELRRRRIETSLDQRVAWGDRVSLGYGLTGTATSWGRFSPHLSPVIERHGDGAYEVVPAASPLGRLTSLRLRAAYGESIGHDGRDVDEAVMLSPQTFVGPPTFRPDRSAELEGGFDAGFSVVSTRISVTAFRRRETIQDLVSLASTSDPASGIARRVTGGEAVAEATPIDIPAARLHLRGQVALNHDRVTHLGLDPLFLASSVSPRLVVAEGESWAALGAEAYRWNDTNGDGRIELSEIQDAGYGAPSGRSRPSSIASLTSDLEVVRSFTLTTVVDHVGGFDVYDMTSFMQCGGGVCPALNDPRASLGDQARAVLAAVRVSSSGFIVPGDATRLREISLSWHPVRTASMLHASSVRVTASAYDLATWSRSRGIHPETDAPAPGYRGDLLWSVVQPIPRTFALRVALGY